MLSVHSSGCCLLHVHAFSRVPFRCNTMPLGRKRGRIVPGTAHSELQTCQRLSEGMVLAWHTITPILQIGCSYEVCYPWAMQSLGVIATLRMLSPQESCCEWWAHFVIVQPWVVALASGEMERLACFFCWAGYALAVMRCLSLQNILSS